MTDAETYRDVAHEMRERASERKSLEAQNELLGLAAYCDTLAEHMLSVYAKS